MHTTTPWAVGAAAALAATAAGAASCAKDASEGDGGSGGAGASTTSTSTTVGGGGAGASGGGGSASGGGGQGAGAGGSAPADPCAAASDGPHCGSALGGNADHGSLYTCGGGVTLTVTPCQSGCQSDACNAVEADPCASAQSGNGAYCGGSLSSGDPAYLYDCQNGSTAGTTFCASGCQVNPPGVADNCSAGGDPCQNAQSGNGLYCGGSLGAGDANTLYDCQGQSTASATVCPNGCQMMPPGQADQCQPTAGGSCCVAEPPGWLTQAYSACGGGGSHYGVDYGTAVGTPIYAGISGTVVGSALGYPNCYDNGCTPSCWNSFNYVKLKSDCGDPADPSRDLFVYYLHIDALAPGVGNGDHVAQGTLVAYSGNSGCSSGPHIHLETVSVPAGGSASLSTCSSVDPATRYCP
ncbi:MAG: M23 family metallopeptidase [Polyangiaceae bacterium]|nr:M23 family metallopeptidase [Polyangiaceae bacterium]